MSHPLHCSLVRILPLGAALLLGACATPSALQGEFAAINPQQAALSESVVVTPVRWGGTILSSSNTPQESCFEILSRPLDTTARPVSSDSEQGRFLACKPGFLDPALFKPGREVTIIGTVNGVEARKVDSFDYRYPKLQAQTIYLWPERSSTDTYYVDPFFQPYPYYFYAPYRYEYRRAPPRVGIEPVAPDTGVVPPRRSMSAPDGGSIAPRLSAPADRLLGH